MELIGLSKSLEMSIADLLDTPVSKYYKLISGLRKYGEEQKKLMKEAREKHRRRR